MINSLKPKLVKRLYLIPHHKTRQTALPYFLSEQSSNDYISSLCKQNQFREALKAFDFVLINTGFQIHLSTYTCLIFVCSTLRSVQEGRKIHSHLKTSNFQPNLIIQNHILNMYGKCGSLRDARKVFDEMEERNLVSWTSMIAGYSQSRQEIDAITLYLQMLESGLMPDHFTFGSIIKACSGFRDINLGRQLHGHVIKSEYGSHLVAQNALIAMYTKCDQIFDAWNVFSCISTKDLISWSSIIAAFSQLGYEFEALCRFKEMLSHGIYQPNEFLFGSVLSACSSLLQPEFGRQIHGISIKYGLRKNIFAGCSLCDMYAKCGFLDYAKSVFFRIENPDLVSWNALIAGFAYGADAHEALSFFSDMRCLGLIPDEITVLSLLCGCNNPLTLCPGLLVHAYIIKMGFDLKVQVSNSILTMYAKCSNISDAFKMFKQMESGADVVSWNAILTACMQHDQAEEVLRLWKIMVHSQTQPDYITLSIIFGACIETAALEMGKQVHCYSIKSGLSLVMSVTNGLIDMYSKCGSIQSARNLFEHIKNPDVVSWSSLIVGYAQCGYAEEALNFFNTMQNFGVKPNEVTIVGVLTACSHVGLVEMGLQLYRTIETEYGIVPTREHCSCIVDMLARSGCLKEAEDFIDQMPIDPDIVVWKTLLAACKTRKNLCIGKRAAENILKFDPFNSTAHVLLCNIYASSGKWEDAARWRGLMKQRGIQKVPGQSWIEVKDTVHVFVADDILHPEREEIFATLDELFLKMLDAGYDSFVSEDSK